MKRKLIIIGNGETAKIAYEYFTFDSDFEVKGFSINKDYIKSPTLFDLPLVALEDIEKKFPPSDYWVFVAVSSSKLNRIRTTLFLKVKGMGYRCASYISSKAFIWRNTEIGENCFIFENNTIQPFVKIGNNVTIWSGNHIGHSSIIKNNCFISSHVVISGLCEIGENCFLGVNSTIIDEIKIGCDCFIGAGALIQKSIPSNTVIQETSTISSKVNASRLFKFIRG